MTTTNFRFAVPDGQPVTRPLFLPDEQPAVQPTAYERSRPVVRITLWSEAVAPSALFSGGVFVLAVSAIKVGATAAFIVSGNPLDLHGLELWSGLSCSALGWLFHYQSRLRQYDQEKMETETYQGQPAVTQAQPKRPKDTYFVQVDETLVRVPDEPRPGALRLFAIALTNGSASFSHEGNTNQRGARDYGYSRDAFDALRSHFVAIGWGVWRNEGQRNKFVELLAAGKAGLRKIADTGQFPPTPGTAASARRTVTNERTNERREVEE